MPGPFPGMDPYLEEEWEDVHARVIVRASELLNESLPEGLVCRAEKRVDLRSGPDEPVRWYKPDDFVAVGGHGPGPAASSATAVLDEVEVFDFEPESYIARWLEVRDRRGREVITTIEVLSPVNKAGGREAFRRKQRELAEGGVSLVEIDLLRRGHWAMHPPEDGVPEAFREPYRLCSTAARGSVPRSRFTRVKLREPLPPIPVPLRPGEPPAVLELQPLIEHAYRTGRYGDHYDLPPPPLPDDDAAWVAERVAAWRAEVARRGEAGETAGTGEAPAASAAPAG